MKRLKGIVLIIMFLFVGTIVPIFNQVASAETLDMGTGSVRGF